MVKEQKRHPRSLHRAAVELNLLLFTNQVLGTRVESTVQREGYEQVDGEELAGEVDRGGRSREGRMGGKEDSGGKAEG